MKLDVSSTALEKGIDLAKSFLDKLIMPSIEETGLLLQEKVTYWKFKNQVKILNKAQDYCVKNGISPKSISLKLLCPLLDNAALEEDEYLQRKWSVLLGNMVDSQQNIENHVFPFLLGQISKNELLKLEENHSVNDERHSILVMELSDYRIQKKPEKELIKKQISELSNTDNSLEFKRTKWRLESKLRAIKLREDQILADSVKVIPIDEKKIEEFEIYNLIRLGVITNISRHYGYTGNIEIPNRPEDDYIQISDIDVQIEKDFDEYIITELGSLFIKACREKT